MTSTQHFIATVDNNYYDTSPINVYDRVDICHMYYSNQECPRGEGSYSSLTAF